MKLEGLRKAASPLMQLTLVAMIGPLTIACGIMELVSPGSGVRFANGALEWVKGLPEGFWIFAGVGLGFHEYRRSVDTKVQGKAIEDLKDVVRETGSRGTIDNPDGGAP